MKNNMVSFPTSITGIKNRFKKGDDNEALIYIYHPFDMYMFMRKLNGKKEEVTVDKKFNLIKEMLNEKSLIVKKLPPDIKVELYTKSYWFGEVFSLIFARPKKFNEVRKTSNYLNNKVVKFIKAEKNLTDAVEKMHNKLNPKK